MMFKMEADLVWGDQESLPPISNNCSGMVSRIQALPVRYCRMFANLAESRAQHAGRDKGAHPEQIKPRMPEHREQAEERAIGDQSAPNDALALWVEFGIASNGAAD